MAGSEVSTAETLAAVLVAGLFGLLVPPLQPVSPTSATAAVISTLVTVLRIAHLVALDYGASSGSLPAGSADRSPVARAASTLPGSFGRREATPAAPHRGPTERSCS